MAKPDSQKPFILYCVPFPEGHLTPALQISAHLVERGFDITMTGLEAARAKIEGIGAHFTPLVGLVGSPQVLPQLFPELHENPEDPAHSFKLVELVFIDMLPSCLDSLRFGLSELNRRDPDRPVVILADTIYPGTMAYKLLGEQGVPPGFRGPPPKTLGISVVPSMFTSIDSGPMGAGLSFDPSPAGRERNKLVAAHMYRGALTSQTMQQRLAHVLRRYAITRSVDELYGDHAKVIHHWVGDASFICHDVTLQMCIPELEYPISDRPAHVKFGGTLPKKALPPDLVYPEWFAEVRAHGTQSSTAGRKKVVMVAQGTVAVNYNLLVIPAIKGLANRDDLLVVVLLCVRGASLDSNLAEFPGGKLPSNVRLIDYFPYDAVLEHADLFLTHSGYGGFQHAVVNGVPIVQVGKGEDKPAVGLRAERAGLGVYIQSPEPGPEEIAANVDKILAGGYKERAQELKAEAARFDTLGKVEQEILALVQ